MGGGDHPPLAPPVKGGEPDEEDFILKSFKNSIAKASCLKIRNQPQNRYLKFAAANFRFLDGHEILRTRLLKAQGLVGAGYQAKSTSQALLIIHLGGAVITFHVDGVKVTAFQTGLAGRAQFGIHHGIKSAG